MSLLATVNILNGVQPFPNSPMSAVIFPENVGKLGDLQSFKDKNLEISGTITEYHDKPEIILESLKTIFLIVR